MSKNKIGYIGDKCMMLNSFSGYPVIVCPKNLKIRCTWRERLYIRWWWPFGSAKWRYESILKENTFLVMRDIFTNRKSIFVTEEGLRYLVRENLMDKKLKNSLDKE